MPLVSRAGSDSRAMWRAAVLLSASLAATNASAAEYHVNNTAACSDSNPGTTSRPLCTVQAGLDRITAAGDVVTIHTGTYRECASYSQFQVGGTVTSPIVVRGAPGEDPNTIILDPSALTEAQCPERSHGQCANTDYGVRAALTLKGGFGTPLRYIRVQDLTIRPTNFEDPGSTGCGAPLGCRHNYGLDLECVVDAEVLNLRSDTHPTFVSTASGVEASGDAIVNIQRSSRVLVKGSDFSHGGSIVPGFHAFSAWSGSSDYWITESHVRDFAGGFIAQSGGNSGVTLTFNDIHHMDDGVDGNNDIQAYNMDNLRVAYNRVFDHKFSVTSIRSLNISSAHPRVAIHNNYFKARGSTQTAVISGFSSDPNQVRLVNIRDNLFEGYSKGIELQNKKILNCNFKENFNAYYNVTTPLLDSDLICVYTLGANSLILGADPLDPNDCPASGGSVVVDAGDPTAAVPVGGGGRVDIGACEFGTGFGAFTAPYDFQPDLEIAANPRPRITWDGVADPNTVNLKDLDFKDFLLGAPQTSYRCQVDKVYTFNSQGISQPLWDSGIVLSASRFCDVGTFLPNGDYWARVRLNSDGIWSAFFKFTELSDTVPPQPPANLRVVP